MDRGTCRSGGVVGDPQDVVAGAGGVGGFFEKTFAPIGLRKIQAQVLGNLKREVEGTEAVQDV